MKRLENQTALITGAASGIGAEAATLFAREGANVAIVDIDKSQGEKIANTICASGSRAVFIKADVSDPDQVQSMLNTAVEVFGSLNILYNSAGIAVSGTIENTSIEDWNRVLNTNLTGTFLCCKYAIPLMRKNVGGSAIITTASSVALVAEKEIAAYAATKGGIIALTRQIALDYAPYHIRANCLCPGWVNTAFNAPFIADPVAHASMMKRMIPVGHETEASEVAQAALMLADPALPTLTGHVFVIDGGLTSGIN